MKRLLFTLLALGLAPIASLAQTDTAHTNLMYSIMVNTNTSPEDVRRLLSRLEEYREGPVSGSTRDIIVLANRRFNHLMIDRIFKDIGFIGMSVEEVDHRLQGIAGKSFEYGLRDWLEKNDLFYTIDSRLRTFLVDSLSADQELLDPLGITYQEAPQNWWQRVGKQSFDYGVGIGSREYAFVSFKFSEDGHTIFYTHVRYYVVDGLSFEQKVEGVVRVPIAGGWSVTGGVSYSPASDSPDHSKLVGVAKVEYLLLKDQEVRFSFGFRPGDDHFFQVGLVKTFKAR